MIRWYLDLAIIIGSLFLWGWWVIESLVKSTT